MGDNKGANGAATPTYAAAVDDEFVKPWENEKQLLKAFGHAVFLEFVIAPVQDYAEGRIISGTCKLVKLCRAPQKLYQATKKYFRRAPNGVHRGVGANATRKVRKPGMSGHDAATDIPSWARGEAPLLNENGRSFSKRMLDEKYGVGNYPTGPGSEFSKLKKFADRAFENPPGT